MGGRGSSSMSDYRRRKTMGTDGGPKGQRKPKPMDVSKFDGKTLQEIENGMRNLSREQLVILDGNGKVIAAFQGNANSVAFYNSDLYHEGATVTHNHPKGAEGYGGTFSTADILNMASSNWAEHRACAAGKGEYNYIVRRTSKTTAKNSNDLYNRVQKDTPMLKAQMDAAAMSSKGLSAHGRRQVYTGIMDNYWSKVLPEYNFEYVSKKESYKYNR